MAGPAAGEGRGGGVATVEAAAGAAGGGARGAAAGGGRGGSSPLANARGTSWSPSSRTFPVAAGRGRGVVAAAKSGTAADDRSHANSSGGASVAPEFKQAAQTVSSASAPAAGAPAACVAVDGGPCLRGKRAAGSPTSRRPGPGSEDDALISSRIAAIAQQLEWAAAASSPEAAAAPGAPQQLPARGPASGTAEPSGPNQDDFAVEVNDCFQKMYSGAYSVDLVVSLLQRLSQAPLGGRDSSLFLAMLRTLFFECRHFPRYPTQQLLLTAELFGKLIASQVLLHQPSASNSVAATNPSSLVIALRCVLEALRKGPNSKMFLFGVAALEQVLTRLYLFPDFLVSLSRLPPHFNLQCPHYTAYIENLLLLIPKRLHRSVYLDPATAAAALPPIPDPPASRGPGATNLTPAVVPAAAAPPGITPSGGALQQQPHQQQGLSHASAASSPTAAASGCLQTTKATSADAGVKPGEGGGERGVTTGAGGVAGMEQQRRQQVQTAGLPQQQGPGKAPRQGGAATSADVGIGGTTVLGSGTATANAGDAAGGGGVLVLGGAGPRPFFAGGAPGMGTAGLCVTAGEQSMGASGGACVGHGGQQPQQEQGTLPSGSGAGGATAGVLQQQQIPANGEPNTLVLGGGGLTTPPTAIGALLQGVGLGQVEGLMNDRELLAKLVLPPQWLAEQVIAACNSVCEANVDDKATALRHVLAPEHQAWLAFYLVKSRASKEPNLHAIFFLFVEKLEMPGLPEIVVSMSYDCINTLLKYLVEAKESSSYRTLLKNLGLWLGRITLGRNRPLMSKRLDLKTLLFRGYDEGHLVAVLPLVCKVLEGVRLSKVFKPPNPWTTAMLSLLAELQQLPNLRTNLIFEVEVLFKHLHINVQDYHGRSHHLARRAVPAASPDFVVRTAVPALDSTAVAGPSTATTAAAAPAGVKPLAAALNIPSATASSLLTAGPPPGMGGPTATLGTAAAAQQQQPTTAAASPPPTGGLRPAAPTHACATPTCAAQPRGQGTTTPERGSGGAADVAVEGGVATGAVCSRLLLAAAAGSTSTAQKLQQQQQQRGATNAAGGQLLESHQAGGSRVAMDAVTAGLRTAAAGGGGAGPAAAGPLQQQMLSQQQQVLAQRQQFPQLQSQGEGAGGSAAEAAGAAAALRGGASRAADETLLQHHQRLLAAASAAVGNGSAGEGVPSTSEDAESLGAAAGGRRDPRSLLLAAGIRGASAGETSSLFMSSGGGAGTYPQQPTAVERSALVSSTTYTGEPQGSVPQAWPSLQEEQQGGADAAALGAGGNTSLLNLLQQQQQQQQQGGSGGAGATLLEQQPQVGAAGGPPPPPTQKSSAAAAAVQHHQATQGSPYRIAAAGGVAGGSSSSGVMEATAGGGGSPPSLFGGSTTAAEAFAAGAGTSSLMPSDSLLQNLAQNVVISPSIALLSLQPGLRPLVPLAVERAVREIISAVAERSVTISCVTTRELVCKDFCMEGEESLIKRAAHLMVASLAGSLALITCREPLRVSLTQNLRQLLQPVASAPECGDQVLVEQVLQIVSTDNLDLGCSVIEQAVVEKVLRDIEISIQPALQLRRQAKERGVPFVDTQYVNSGRWPMALPEPLKLHPLLNTRQLQVYKDFMLIGPLRKMHQQHVYGTQQQQQVQQQQPLQQQQRGSGCQQQQQQQQMVGGQQQHGVGGATAGGGGGGATSTAGSLASGSGRDSGEGAAGAVFGAAGGTLLSAAATASGRLPSATQQQQREAIQQMAATVAAARALNQQQQQQQKLMQLQQQGAPPGHSTDLADGLPSTRQLAAATAGAAAAGLGAAPAGSSPQQQQTRSSLNAQQSSYGGTAGLNMQYQIHIPQYSGQEQSLSVLMLRLEGCLVQLRDVVRDIFNSPPVMPTPSTAHQFSYPAGCQMLALPVPLCSTSALLVFACLPSNHELFQLIASVSSVASSCSRMDEVAPALAHKLIKSVFEGAALAAHRGVVGSALRGVDPTGLYMEVFFAVLAALRRESEVVGKLAGEVLSISCASATLPPKRSNVAVAAGLMRYGLIDFSAFDGVLASHLEGGRNAPVVEFVLVLLKVLQDQHAVSPAVLPNTFKTLAAADALPPRVVQLRGWQCLSLTEARDKLLETFQQREAAENKDGLPYLTTLTQLMEDYCVPAYPVKVRCLAVLPEISVETQRLVRRIFEDWIRLCTLPATLSVVGAAAAGGGGGGTAGGGGGGFSWMTPGTQQQQPTTQGTNLFVHRRLTGTSEGGGAIGGAAAGSGTAGGQQQPCGSAAWGEENASLHRAMFFQKVSQQGLLRMDEDTDRFFAVCVDVAVEKATVMLQVQAARNGNSGSKQQSAAAAVGKDCASSSAAEATKTLAAACDSGAAGKGVSTPHSKNRSSSSNTGERTPRQQQQAKVESETREEGGEAAPTFMDKIGPGELSSSSTNEGQGTDSSLSSSSSGTGAGASQKPAAGHWGATVAGRKTSTEDKGKSGAAESGGQLKTDDGAQEQQETNQQQEHQARSTGATPEAADTDARGEQLQQQTAGVLAVDPTMSAEALTAMETPPEETEAPLDVVPLDSLAKMIAAMMRFVDPQQVSPVLILQRALGVLCRHMHMQAEALGSSFNQRPYFRLLLSILLEVTSSAAFPLASSGGAATAGGGGAAGAAGSAAGGSGGSQQQQQQSSSSSDGENAAAGAGVSSPRGGGADGGAVDTAAAVAQQQLLLHQSILSFADHLALLCPMRLPAFAFAWLELVGHRTFLPLLLRGPSGMRGNPRSGWVALHKLLLLHFEFIHPFLASVSLSDSVRQLYKGTLRVLLVLLHDFPEYLCETYVDCCSVLPLNCVQLRNVILSAFPRNMRLPDPFLPNLRVDLLPEVKIVPRLLLTHSFYSVLLLHQRQKHQLLKGDVDMYWQSRDPTLLPRIRKKLLLPCKAEALKRGTKYDVPLFNAFLLYVATSVPEHDPRSCGSISSAVLPPGPLPPALDGSCSSSNGAAAAGERGGGSGSAGGYGADSNSVGYGCNSMYHVLSGGDISGSSNGLGPEGSAMLSPALEIILYLAKELDMEGRYLLMSAIANHLRYPNAHTHFFSNLLLWLFSESKEELVQEQITRVLLERLIVHRPHPWGLLITFIELIKNPRFAFWSCLFVSAAPEVEKLFQSVAHTCLGQSGAQQLQQQRQR